jgi:beta-glucosidase
MKGAMDRRRFLVSAGAAALVGAATRGGTATPAATDFPKGFLWGAATAAHQVEGNNVNSDNWLLEHVKPTLFAEPSLSRGDRAAQPPLITTA